MKSIFIILIILVCASFTVAQEIPTVAPDSALTGPQQKELSPALQGVDYFMDTTVNNLDELGNSDLGKMTMFLVGYHVLGKYLISYVVGPMIGFMSLWFFVWIFKNNCMSRRVATSGGVVSYEVSGEARFSYFLGFVCYTLANVMLTLHPTGAAGWAISTACGVVITATMITAKDWWPE